MPSPRLPHTRATADRAGGGDVAEVPCAGRWTPFEVLIERTSGDEWRSALAEARAMCARCPIWQTCLTENRGEEWAAAVVTGKTLQQRVAAKRGQVQHGTPAGARHHQRNGTRPCPECRRAEADRSKDRRTAA